MIDEGGRVVGSTIAHPIIRRSGLLMDSEITSRYDFSFRPQRPDIVKQALSGKNAGD